MGERLWVIDVEGNGGCPPEIIELAMVELSDLSITGLQRHWLIQPKHPITSIATRIHGLTNADLAGSPSMEDIADDVIMWIDNIPIVGHNVRVEVEILERSLLEWKAISAIDTIKLARAMRPGLASYGLVNVGSMLGLLEEAESRTGARHHSALYDATLTALIFIKLMREVPGGRRAQILSNADILRSTQGSLF